jgi:predicted DCC family thiol-disulfide oxidoreductase YuxK
VGTVERTVYFDGYCNLCNAAIDFLIRHDRRQRLKFASLQGETAAKRLPPEFTQELGTMVYQEGDRVWKESSAALRSGIALGGIYSVGWLALVVPSFVRDPIYRFIAKHRYQWFGKRETCRLPTPEERARFLP